MLKNIQNFIIPLIIGLVLGLLLSVILQFVGEEHETVKSPPDPQNISVRIDKSDLQLILFNDGQEFKQYKISDGKNPGDKQKKGDCRTPVGTFEVISIERSADWEYDFEDDDLGPIKGAYGPYFLRLATPGWKGIGIHGTHDPTLIGFHNSHGCIRLKNSDLLDLLPHVTLNTVVEIRE